VTNPSNTAVANNITKIIDDDAPPRTRKPAIIQDNTKSNAPITLHVLLNVMIPINHEVQESRTTIAINKTEVCS